MPELKTTQPTLDDVDEPTTPPERIRDTDGVPMCPVHICRMKATSSGPKGSRKTYYKCPVPKCEETGVKVRKPPHNPTTCPKCAKVGDTVYCEKNKERSRRGLIVMTCPACGYSTPGEADPRMADMVQQYRKSRPKAAYGER